MCRRHTARGGIHSSRGVRWLLGLAVREPGCWPRRRMLAKGSEHWLRRGAQALSAAKNFLPRWADCGGETDSLHACLKLTKFKNMPTRKFLLHRKIMQDTESMQKLKVMKPISPSEIVWKLWWKGLVRKRKTIVPPIWSVAGTLVRSASPLALPGPLPHPLALDLGNPLLSPPTPPRFSPSCCCSASSLAASMIPAALLLLAASLAWGSLAQESPGLLWLHPASGHRGPSPWRNCRVTPALTLLPVLPPPQSAVEAEAGADDEAASACIAGLVCNHHHRAGGDFCSSCDAQVHLWEPCFVLVRSGQTDLASASSFWCLSEWPITVCTAGVCVVGSWVVGFSFVPRRRLGQAVHLLPSGGLLRMASTRGSSEFSSPTPLLLTLRPSLPTRVVLLLVGCSPLCIQKTRRVALISGITAKTLGPKTLGSDPKLTDHLFFRRRPKESKLKRTSGATKASNVTVQTLEN